MRITQSVTYRNFLATVEKINSNMDTVSQQISSGKKLVHLSDSPSSSAELIGLSAESSQIDQYSTNTDSGTFFLGVTDSSLSSVQNLFTSIFTEGSQAASNLNTASDRASLAQAIRALRDEVLSAANAKAQGRYIFAGSNVTTSPFTIVGDRVTYHGDSEVNKIEVGDGLQVRSNVPGDTVFPGVFDKINDLLTAVDNGDPEQIKIALGQFSSTLDAIGVARAQVGTDLGTLQNAKSEQNTRQTNVKMRMGTLNDTDMAQAVTQLTQIQTQLKAALTAESSVQQHNLFDFLG